MYSVKVSITKASPVMYFLAIQSRASDCTIEKIIHFKQKLF